MRGLQLVGSLLNVISRCYTQTEQVKKMMNFKIHDGDDNDNLKLNWN